MVKPYVGIFQWFLLKKCQFKGKDFYQFPVLTSRWYLKELHGLGSFLLTSAPEIISSINSAFPSEENDSFRLKSSKNSHDMEKNPLTFL